MRNQPFAKYIRYLKRIESYLKQEISDFKKLEAKTDKIIKQNNLELDELFKNRTTELSNEEREKNFTRVEELLEYQKYILDTNITLSRDIYDFQRRLRAVKNTLDYLPLG